VGSGPARPVSSPLLITPRAWLRRLLRPDAPFSLQGRTVLVTGASSGIGESTVHAVAARGATVLLVARRADRLAQVLAAIERDGGTAHAYPCDLTDGPAVDRLVATITERHGAVDYLVNNAGRSIRRSIALSYDRVHDIERTMAINYVAPVRLTLGLLPHMVDQGFGHVVNVLTWGVQVKAPKFSAYIASKTALDTWSRIAGRELYADGVTFSNLRLPLVRTDMIGPTDSYANAPALTAEQAAARVVRALEDRPLTVNTLPGNIAEVLNLLAPRASDALQWAIAKRFPDSAAASGTSKPQRRPAG
jgi:short-subunit dehydrogenase